MAMVATAMTMTSVFIRSSSDNSKLFVAAKYKNSNQQSTVTMMKMEGNKSGDITVKKDS